MLRGAGCVLAHKQNVEIGAVPDLAAAEFSERDYGEVGNAAAKLIDKNEARLGEIGLLREDRRQIGDAENVAQKNSQALGVAINADPIERCRRYSKRPEPLQVTGDGELTVEHVAARDFFEQLRPTDEQIAGIPTGVECFDQQLEQPRMRDKQFEEHAAQSVGIDESDELIQSRVGISGVPQFFEQERLQTFEHLTCAWRDVKATAATTDLSERFLRARRITRRRQRFFFARVSGSLRFRNDAVKDRAHLAHLRMQLIDKFARRLQLQAARQAFNRDRIVRYGVRLLLGLDL